MRPVELDAPCVEHLDLRTSARHHAHRVAGATAFWFVAFTFLVVLVGTTVPAPLYVIYQGEWGFSAGVLTLVFAIYSAGVLTALLGFGRLIQAQAAGDYEALVNRGRRIVRVRLEDVTA